MITDKTLTDSFVAQYWSPEACTIEKCTDGTYAIVDHSIQSTVAVADTVEELQMIY